MTTAEKTKRPILRFLSLIALLFALICLGVFGYYRAKYERQILQSKEPEQIVGAFVEALMSNNFRFAEKLVVSEQKGSIDKWKADTNHKSHDCPGSGNWSLDDFLEPFEWGVSGSGVIDDNTVRVDSSFGCNYSGYSIRIEGVIVKYNGKNWRITDWDKICESSDEYDSPRVCYPKD